MIKIEKNLKVVPKSLNYSEIEDKLNELLQNKNGNSIKSEYNDECVQLKLREVYKEKCCFCETKEKPKNNNKYQVEHYRPKAGVAEDATHLGYYWLGYEWSNLLWCCPKCNRNKTTQFPVKNKYVSEPDTDKKTWRANSPELLAEEPYLLHPEIDDIENHIEFNASGEILGKTDRGQKTIEICKLDRLKKERKELIDYYFKKLKNQFRILIEEFETLTKANGKLAFYEVFSEIKERQNPECEYSALFKNFYQNFETFCDETEVIKSAATKEFIKKSFGCIVPR